MKPLTQKETLELIKTKKLSPTVLKSYKITEDEDEISDTAKLAEAIKILAIAFNKFGMDSKDEIKSLISALNNQLAVIAKKEQPAPKITVTNELPDRANETWEMLPKRDNRGLIMSVTIKPTKEANSGSS